MVQYSNSIIVRRVYYHFDGYELGCSLVSIITCSLLPGITSSNIMAINHMYTHSITHSKIYSVYNYNTLDAVYMYDTL